MNIFERIENTGIIPVIKISDPATAVPLAQALIKGGLPAAEITFRTPCAAEAISLITHRYPDMLVGAGTVLTVDQAKRAAQAGAAFIVSPGLNPDVVKWCISAGVPVIPGCATPSDIEAAIGLGLDTVKFFPAEAAGGIEMIKALSAPYNIKFMPTGGINEKNLNAYLSHKRVIACGGSFMVTPELIEEGKFEEISALTRKAVMLMHGFSLAHVGIDAQNAEEAKKNALLLSALFGFEIKELPVSYFAGPFEIMNQPGSSKNGHLGVGVNSVPRAYEYLKNKGIEFEESGILRDSEGRMFLAFLKEEILGFSLHLCANI